MILDQFKDTAISALYEQRVEILQEYNHTLDDLRTLKEENNATFPFQDDTEGKIAYTNALNDLKHKIQELQLTLSQIKCAIEKAKLHRKHQPWKESPLRYWLASQAKWALWDMGRIKDSIVIGKPNVLNRDLYYGLFGEITEFIKPQTEADPCAIYLQLIVTLATTWDVEPSSKLTGQSTTRIYLPILLVIPQSVAREHQWLIPNGSLIRLIRSIVFNALMVYQAEKDWSGIWGINRRR
jgi:hypothetical protein